MRKLTRVPSAPCASSELPSSGETHWAYHFESRRKVAALPSHGITTSLEPLLSTLAHKRHMRIIDTHTDRYREIVTGTLSAVPDQHQGGRLQKSPLRVLLSAQPSAHQTAQPSAHQTALREQPQLGRAGSTTASRRCVPAAKRQRTAAALTRTATKCPQRRRQYWSPPAPTCTEIGSRTPGAARPETCPAPDNP